MGWTKETESTWLTSTDTDIPLSSIHSIPSESSEAHLASEVRTVSPDFFEDVDGLLLPAQAYLKVCSAASDASFSKVKPGSLSGSGGGAGVRQDHAAAQKCPTH